MRKKSFAVLVVVMFSAALIACGSEKGSGSAYVPPDSDFEYTVDSDTNTVTITKYTGNAREITFPSEIDGKAVTAIGISVLRESDCVTSVVIPDSVTLLSESVFQAQRQLVSVELSKNITVIPKYAFQYCESLESIVIPEGVTEIGRNAFQDCTGLESVIFPDSIIKCDNDAFLRCMSLPEITYRGITYVNDGDYMSMYDLIMAIRIQQKTD